MDEYIINESKKNISEKFFKQNLTKQEKANKFPKHLNWKCLDDFKKVQDEKLFYVGRVKLSHMQRNKLSTIFKEVRRKYDSKLEALINSWHEVPQTHLEISGGTYTYSLVLPYIIPRIRKFHPHLCVKISLYEVGDENRASLLDSDIALFGILLGDYENNSSILSKFKNSLYNVDRKYVYDNMFFAASNKFIEEFGGLQKTLESGDLLFGRDYVDVSNDLQARYLYSTIPSNRKNINPRVIADQYYMKYLLMRNSVGIGHIHKSMSIKEDLTILDSEPFARYKRFCITKNKLNKRYTNINKMIIKILKGREIK